MRDPVERPSRRSCNYSHRPALGMICRANSAIPSRCSSTSTNTLVNMTVWGYLLHATERNRRWFDQGCKRSRIYLHSLLGQAIEQFAARGRRTTVESKGELVEISVQVIVSDRTLMGAEQPSLQQRDHALHARQQLRRGFLLPA